MRSISEAYRSPEPLLVKLQMPGIKPGTVFRDRLLSQIINSLDHKLLMIIGDAGYGKTTLLVQVKEKAHLPCVFVSLEAGDSDLVTFFSCLIWGLERFQPGLARRCKTLVERGTDLGQNPRLAMGTLLNELMEKRNEELFILLDDVHNLSDDSPVHAALDYFIDHLPATVHVIISSRKEPPLPSLPKWKAKRDVAELSREALRFSEDDTKTLLTETYGMDISPGEIKNIVERTEGWITGLHLILQSCGNDVRKMRENIDSYMEESGDLFRYFAGEIFSREKMATRDFLRKSSVFEIMTPDACGNVLNEKDPDRMLSELSASNLFVTQSGKDGYRYHRLFREFLYDQLTDTEERNLLHARAAGYFEKLNDRTKAIGHYISAGMDQEAVRLIALEREGMINRAQFAQLRSWLERLSSQAYLKNPWLYAVQAVLYKEKGKLEQAEDYYRKAEQGIKGTSGQGPSQAYVLYEKSIVLHRKGEYNQAIETLAQALRACPPENRDLKISILGFTAQVWLEGLGNASKAKVCLTKARGLLKGSSNNMQAVYIEQKQAILLESEGDKRQAFNVYKGIIEKIGDQYSHLVGSYFHNAAKVALDYGRIEWAEQCLKKGQVLCRGYEDAFSESMLEFGFGYLYLFRGNWDQAEKHLNKALQIFREMNWTRSVCIALRQMSRLNRYRSDLSAAEHYLDLMKQQPLGPLDRIAVLLEQTLIEIQQKRYGKAQESLDSCREPAIKYFGRMGEIICNLAEAGVRTGQKHNRNAEKWLARAIVASKDYGFDGLLSCELKANQLLAKLAGACKDEKLYLRTIPSFGLANAKTKTEERLYLRFELLGPPKILNGKKDIASGLRHQAQELLCLLAYHQDRGLTRDEILQAMWPSAKPKQGIDNFHLVMFELRNGLKKALGRNFDKAIIKESGRYLFAQKIQIAGDFADFDRLWTESKEAERAADIKSAKALIGQALELIRSDFCAGWSGNWVQELSRRYEDQHQKMLLKLGSLHLRDNELKNSREFYAAAFARDGLCEEAARGLIRIDGAQGEINQVKNTYIKLQKALMKELKAKPSQDTIEIYNRYLS